MSIAERLGLNPVIITLKSGREYKNYPLKGFNLHTPEQITEHLSKYGTYFLKTGNNRDVMICVGEVEKVVQA